jgi:hypothetical protein
MKSSTVHSLRLSPVLLVFCVLYLILPQVSKAAAGDQFWDPEFAIVGTTNSNIALAVNNGTIVAGGFGTPSTNAALMQWDGHQWSALGVFNSASSAFIYDAAYVGGTLYVGGIFSSVNGVAANGLARWNGSAWSAVGFTGEALTFAVSGGNLYVGGFFNMLDSASVTMTNIGLWDGSAWHALGAGLGQASSGSVRSLALSGGTLYAGGSFTNSASATVSNIAVWNGATWTAVGGGVGGGLIGIAASGGNLYVVGNFTQAGSTAANDVAQWNGSAWLPLGTGFTGGADSVAVFNNLVCVSGSFTSAGGVTATNFAVWNGSLWAPAGNGLSSTAYRVISDGTNVIAGGNFGVAGTVWTGGVAAWDGTNWSGFATPGRVNGMQGSVFALANDGSNIYAGGLFNFAGPSNAACIARFDGTNWHPLGSGITTSGGSPIVRALACSGNQLYAGGNFATAGGIASPDIAQWNGTNWSSMGGGPGGVVAAILVQPSGIYAVGAPTSGTQYGSPFFDVWNGSSWQGVSYNIGQFGEFDTYFLDPNIGMDALAVSGTNMYIGGHFIMTEYANFPNGAVTCSNIMAFDGTNAWTVGSGLNSNVVTMAVLGTKLYVGGLFTNAGGVTASQIAVWNGTAWSAVGSGVIGNGTVNSMTALGNLLYVGGTFTNMGGVAGTEHIAQWDGTNWHSLGSGITPTNTSHGVLSMMAFGSDLYVGGSILTTGTRQSYYIGRWNPNIDFLTPQILNPSKTGSGQFQAELYGWPGASNVIQATLDFQTWTPILTNTNGIYQFTDTNTGSFSSGFYRAMLGP